MSVIYFAKIKFKRKISIKIANTLLFINYLLAFCYGGTPYLIYIPIVIYLGTIFYLNKTNICKPNILFVISILTYVLNFLIPLIKAFNLPFLSEYRVTIIFENTKNILSTIYLIPMLSYFRLYGNNLIEKRFKNGK